MAAEGFEVEEWDAEFLDQLVQAEELAISTTFVTQQPEQQLQQQLLHHHPPPPPPPLFQPPPLPAPPYANISYSPPRELSQRVHDSVPLGGHGNSSVASTSISVSVPNGPECAKEREIDGLKRELSCVSEQLKVLEEECIDLRKQRDKNEEQLKFISARIEARAAENSIANSISLHNSVGKHGDDDGLLPESQKNKSSNDLLGISIHPRTSASKAVGVQTEDAGESDNSYLRNDEFVGHHLHHKKLLEVWDLSEEKIGENLASNLFGTCEADLKVLFGYLNLNLPSNTLTEHAVHESNVPSANHWQSSHSTEAAKILHLYLMLTKIGNHMAGLEDLLEALVDCCRLKNGIIVHRSLRVLHVVIKHASCVQKKIGRRENIIVTGPSAEHILPGMGEVQSFKQRNSLYPNANKVLNQQDSNPQVKWSNFSPSVTNFDWVSLFGLMSQIAMENHEEQVRLEAVSNMNIILTSSTAYSEKEKFGGGPVFQCISHLLRKEAGFCVQKQAIDLFYQLLNCPKVTAAFCFDSMEICEVSISAEIDNKTHPSFEEFNAIIDGLIECVPCTGNSTKALKLRRSAITVMAFIASLGKVGVGIILSHRPPPERTNVLTCILKSLTTDLDLEPLESAQSVEIFRERTLLIREALILLNRLVSHPKFSTAVLQALTSGREVTSLTIDVAKRLSHQEKFLWQGDSITKQIREFEIVELARVFKRRVFAFLGDSVS